MKPKLWFFMCISLCLHQNILGRNLFRGLSKDTNPYEAIDLERDYGVHSRRYSNTYRVKSNPVTTTSRPFISYWQNVMRNVRLPVPTITWNITNPLANLFSMQTEQLETPIVEDFYPEPVSSNSPRRHKHKRRRKHSNKQRRKNTHQIEIEPPIDEPQISLQEYPKDFDTNTPMYFYDPSTDAYYAVQRVKALGSYIEGTVYDSRKFPKSTTTDNPILENDVAKKDGNKLVPSKKVEDFAGVDQNNFNEVTEIDSDQLTSLPVKNQSTENENNLQKELPSSGLNEETLRSVLGSFRHDDGIKRHGNRHVVNSVKQRPRMNSNYFFLFDI